MLKPSTDYFIFWVLAHHRSDDVINTLRPRQNGRHFADDSFKYILLNKTVWIPIKISLKFVPTGAINNIPALVQLTAWRRSGDKPSSEPVMVSYRRIYAPLALNELKMADAWPTRFRETSPYFDG